MAYNIKQYYNLQYYVYIVYAVGVFILLYIQDVDDVVQV